MGIQGTQTNNVISSVLVAQNTTSASFPSEGIDLDKNNVQGSFGAHIVITGSGTATIGIECSNDGSTWIKPSSPSAPNTALTIATGLTATGGPSSNGKYFFPISVIPNCNYLRLYATETANSASVTVNLILSFQ